MRIVLATRNPGKIREFRRLLAEVRAGGIPVEWIGLEAFPEIGEIPEDGATFAANARHKALEVARRTGEYALADDSGLRVDALGGRPGVRSARYAGPGATDAANNRKLLAELAGVPPERRTAHYAVVLALAAPSGETVEAEGRVDGVILDAERGAGGFGYDPLFYVPEYGATFGEVDPARKDAVSHRARAARALVERLADFFAAQGLG